jgi:hypothetical protein
MQAVHQIVAYAIVAAFALLAVWGLVARILGREDAGWPFWGLLHYTENVLLVQIAIGVILLLLGRRVGGPGFQLHYVYGSVFPLIAVIGGRLYGLRREEHEYVPVAFGAFVAFGLTARALMTGLGIG